MDDHSTGVMVALLPITTDWCQIKLPHVTMVYCGKTTELKPTVFNDLAKDTSALAAMSRPLTVKVMGVEIFGGGEDERVDVLRLQMTPELFAMRRFLEKWNASEFNFRPHATIGPAGSSFGKEIPSYLAFDRLCVQWGDDMLMFNMRRS